MTTSADLPPVAPHVVAAAVEMLTSRLRRKLDAAVDTYAAAPTETGADGVRVTCGAEAVVTLVPGPSGAITGEDGATCSCLLAPRCLHRAAVLSACPVADAEEAPQPGETPEPEAATGAGAAGEPGAEREADPGAARASQPASPSASAPASASASASAPTSAPPARVEPTRAQKAAAAAVWSAAASVLASGVPAAGAVAQAELLRAAHAARLAGLYRAEAASLRVVRGLRAARDRHDGHRLADLVSALHELLLVSGLLAASDSDPALVGTARRGYEAGGGLRVQGVCREPVLSATGYAGVVTHVLADDGRWFSVSDVKPGGLARARGAATAPVAIGGAAVDHLGLSRGGLLISGATVSPDGRLGAGRGVRASPVAGLPWSDTTGPLAELFARPLAETVAARLAQGDAASEDAGSGLVGCDLVVVGATGEYLLARQIPAAAGGDPDGEPFGPVIRLAAAHRHPDLAHTHNLRQLAARPGLRIRTVGRLDPGRAVTLYPLAVGPVPGAGTTLRLPDAWAGHADLGYDRFQGAHLPPVQVGAPPVTAAADLLADSPLWRARRMVELAVAGGRRPVAESARATGARADLAPLHLAGFRTAAGLATALAAEADRRERDVFGRLADAGAGNDRYAWAWLAAVAHLTATERALVQSSWQTDPAPAAPVAT